MARNPEITPDLLLAHAGFVRSLARQLLRDEALVEDVVQETYMRALQAGPRKKEALTAWLRSVTRNVAFKAMRSSRRRVRREQAAARDEGLPSTADLVQREQSLKSVVHSVLELPEHYRQVVMLRYFEDLPPRKIAVRLDLPVNTVRMRLHRALKQLRGALDSEYGEPGAWCVGVAVLAGVPRPSALSQSLPQAAGRNVPLPSLALTGAAGIAACTALVFAWLQFTGGGDAESPKVAASAASTGGGAPGEERGLSSSAAGARAGREEVPQLEALAPRGTEGLEDQSPLAASASVVRGIVVDAAGAPVANATVYGEERPDRMRACGRTGPRGSFTVDVGAERAVQARNRALPVLFGARARGYAPSAVAPWRGDGSIVRIVLRPGGAQLSGVVRDPSGAPIAGALIEIGDSYRLGTSFLGAQVLSGEPGPGRLMPSQYSAPGRAAFLQRVEHARGYLGPQTLSAEGELGRLLPPAKVESDADGKWSAAGLEPERAPVRVSAPGFAPRLVYVDLAPPETHTIDVELEPGARLAGQARRDDGLPLGVGLVYVVGDEGGVRRSTRIGDEGRFALRDLPAGHVRVFAESKTGALVTHSAQTELDLTSGTESNWDVLLTPREILLGALVDAEDRPLADWHVQVRLHENPSRPIAQTKTDASGHFALQARPPFAASVYVYHPGQRAVHPSRVVEQLWEGPGRHVIRLTRNETLGASVTGRILSDDPDAIDALTRVLLVPEGSRHVYSLAADEDGVFRSEGMPDGRYWLVMPAHGIGWVRDPVLEVAPGLPHDLGEVRLPELGHLRLYGLPGLDPGPRLRVSRITPGGFQLVLFEGRAHPPLEVAMAPGTYTLERLDGAATRPDTKPLEVTVAPGESTRVNLSVLR